ncbi:uncharacterized protein BDW70DRAFT_149631 [Aspergillus foveolatus]|uniref:uncharacterized protein n=1 Tax=Aspergillus foveolatus TaxID=210207 RepID=UPI003CCE1C8A
MQRSVYALLTLSAMRGLSDSAQILDASEPGFKEITPRWTQYRPPTYYGAIIPATEADVQHIVRTSVEHHIPFLVTEGGHGLTTTLGQFSGMAIELSQFNTVKLDRETGQITLGVGATLGGGPGIGQGIYGLGLDALLSVHLITATGDIAVASGTDNQDLFWAIRGAGASFGIVTSATFQLHDAVNGGIVALTKFTYSPERNRSVWEALQSYDENIPDELSFNLAAVVNATTRERFLQPFIEIGRTSVQSMTLPWTQVYDTVHSTDQRLCTPGQYLNEYTIALKRTDVDAFTAYYIELYALWVREERYEGDWIIARSPTRVMRRVSDEETVFPHRHAITHLLFGKYYSSPLEATSGYDKLHAYTNFAQGDEGPGAWYGSANLKRLRALKSKWDPDAVFNNFNPVLP